MGRTGDAMGGADQHGATRRLLVAVVAIAVVMLSGAGPVGGPVRAQPGAAGEGAAGEDAASASHTPDPPRVAVVARADDPVDALAASAMAAQLGGTVLLTPQDHLGVDAQEGIGDLRPDVVVLAGGEAALSPQVRQDLEDLAAQPEISFTVDRVAGPNRLATARALSRYFIDTVPYYMALRERDELNRVASATGGAPDAVSVAAGGSETVLQVDVSAMPPGWLDLSGGASVESDDATSFACSLRLDGDEVAGSRRSAVTGNPEEGTAGAASGFGSCETSATVQVGTDAGLVELRVDTSSALDALQRSLTARFVPHDAEGHRP